MGVSFGGKTCKSSLKALKSSKQRPSSLSLSAKFTQTSPFLQQLQSMAAPQHRRGSPSHTANGRRKSIGFPAAQENFVDSCLEFLQPADSFPSEEDAACRKRIVDSLDMIVKKWVRRVAWERRVDRILKRNANAKIFLFGSYRLGVYGPDSDIDTLCVGPEYATLMEDFFIVLYNMLANWSGITELHPIQNANVPLIRFKINGISIDLLYARLPLSIIPEDLDITQDILNEVHDQTTIQSLNGYCSAEQILRLVPDLQNFRFTLQYIKFWAKKRGIYSHMVGFLGGGQWALLVARICRKCPDGIPSSLVSEFFHVYAQWQWSRPVKMIPNYNPSDLQIPDVMQIITPVYPYMNTSRNVTISTLKILKEEFQRADKICKASREMNMSELGHLSEPYPFFEKYHDFICISITAADGNDFLLWKGFVESRFRRLISQIEKLSDGLLQCHPNPCPFIDYRMSKPQCKYFWGLQDEKLYEKGLIQHVVKTVATEFRDLVLQCPPGKAGREIHISRVDQNQIPLYCFESESHFVQCSRRHHRPVVGHRSKGYAYHGRGFSLGLIEGEALDEGRENRF
eukprot:c28048_g1_i1 orf=266-1978(-)